MDAPNDCLVILDIFEFLDSDCMKLPAYPVHRFSDCVLSVRCRMLPHRSSPEPHTYSWWLYLEINRRMQQVIPPGESLCCSAASSARRHYRLLISTSVELCGLSFRLCRRGQLTLPPPRLGTRELQPYKLQSLEIFCCQSLLLGGASLYASREIRFQHAQRCFEQEQLSLQTY